MSSYERMRKTITLAALPLQTTSPRAHPPFTKRWLDFQQTKRQSVAVIHVHRR